MIELRWLRIHMNDVGSMHPSGFKEPGIPYMRVLQYRQPRHVHGLCGALDVLYSEWMDIPIVDYRPVINSTDNIEIVFVNNAPTAP